MRLRELTELERLRRVDRAYAEDIAKEIGAAVDRELFYQAESERQLSAIQAHIPLAAKVRVDHIEGMAKQ